MQFTWVTDIHLNFLERAERLEFYASIASDNKDIVLISGDIAEAPKLQYYLVEMALAIEKPIYFVLGNHDYYRSYVDETRKAMFELTTDQPLLHWLREEVYYFDDTALVGIDGWADGRYGDFQYSHVELNDSNYIYDLRGARILGKYSLLDKMQWLANCDAFDLRQQLNGITYEKIKKILIVTHVPPFEEAAINADGVSDPDYLPYFASKALGDVILETAQQHPDHEFLVLCGHTHFSNVIHPEKNLTVATGHAIYSTPEIQKLDFGVISGIVHSPH